jgi:hypothetical protein
MTTGTQTIAEFLLEQIAADEAVARAAAHLSDGGGRWWVDGPAAQSGKHWIYATGEKFNDREIADFIAHQDPAHVLAVCEAHRRIVELHVEDEGVCRVCQWDRDCDQPVYTHNDDPAWLYPCPTLRALAAIYADRDGFREEWE